MALARLPFLPKSNAGLRRCPHRLNSDFELSQTTAERSLEMKNGWQQMLPAAPLLYWMNRDDLPMSVAARSAASAAVGAIASMTAMVSTAS